MTPERKEEIQRLVAVASPGPWTYDETVGDVYAEKTDEIICSDVRNAPFIAAAITLVPELLAALEDAEQTELYKSHDQLRDQNSRLLMNNHELQGELSEAQQTIARARHIAEVPPAVFGEGFDWEFHYKSRRKELLKVLEKGAKES